MFKKRMLTLFLLLTLVALALCACGDSTQPGNQDDSEDHSSGEIVYGGEIVVGIAQDLEDSLDPYQMVAAGTREVLFNLFEGLVKPNSAGDYVPAVASDYSISDDRLTYTFTLRDGVLFHNGETVTADDVLYSFETCASTTIDLSLQAALEGIQDISAEGNTVTITLTEPNNDFISYVAGVYIIPQDYADQATNPVGTGPFHFVSRSIQEELVLSLIHI